MKIFDVIILGGGVHGLSAAYWLGQQRKLRVALIEQFRIGNPLGSSSGFSRTTRTAYDHPDLARLMQEVNREYWPYFERKIGSQIFYPNRGCLFGFGEAFKKYIQAVQTTSVEVDILAPKKARILFPHFRFDREEEVLFDKSAGTLAASSILKGLKNLCIQSGIAIFEETKATLDLTRDPLVIHTDRENYATKKLLLTVGPWISKLLPSLEKFFSVKRQTLCYFKMKGGKPWGIGEFPNWSYIGEEKVFYGLPEFGCEGIKIAQHITKGPSDNPDEVLTEKKGEVRAISEFVKKEFTSEIQSLLTIENCLYTTTPNEQFILDFYPSDSRVIIGAACSGHGFKFAPLIGKALADLATKGSGWLEFEKIRKKLFLFRTDQTNSEK